MQIWLPSESFAESCQLLDYRRLGKQRVEADQILDAIDNEDHGYHSHPTTKMWKDYKICLKVVMDITLLEWEHRNYNNNMQYNYQKLVNLRKAYEYMDEPEWLYGEIHHYHRGNLLNKNEKFYSQYNWNENKIEERYYPIEDGVIHE